MVIKDWIRKQLLSLPVALTQNIKNDQITIKIMQQLLKPDSCCIDVGCHKGEISDIMLKYSHFGTHFGFEPIPFLFENLKTKYKTKNITIYDIALSNYVGESTFNLVKTNPAYSGLIKRKYDRTGEVDETIKVKVDTLDHIINSHQKIDFIKIDTEGGEFGVLTGGEQLISKWKPTILFEFGLGASDYYGTTPESMYNFFQDKGMNLYTQSSFIKRKEKLTFDSFNEIYKNQLDYIFVASKV